MYVVGVDVLTHLLLFMLTPPMGCLPFDTTRQVPFLKTFTPLSGPSIGSAVGRAYGREKVFNKSLPSMVKDILIVPALAAARGPYHLLFTDYLTRAMTKLVSLSSHNAACTFDNPYIPYVR